MNRITPWRCRRHLSFAIGLMVMVCLATAASARADEDAAQFVQDLGHKAIDMLSDASRNTVDRKRIFRSLLIEHFNIKKIGRLVMGRHWRAVSDPQKEEFYRLFEKFIVATYSDRLSEYSGEQFTVGVTRQNGERITAVASKIMRPGGGSVSVDWMLQRHDDRWHVVDVVIEGISMVITQRAEFGAVISQRGGIDGLLRALRRKADAAASGQT